MLGIWENKDKYNKKREVGMEINYFRIVREVLLYKYVSYFGIREEGGINIG